MLSAFLLVSLALFRLPLLKDRLTIDVVHSPKFGVPRTARHMNQSTQQSFNNLLDILFNVNISTDRCLHLIFASTQDVYCY